MKKKTFLIFAMFFALLSSALHAQTDVTSQFLTNPSFDDAPVAYAGPGTDLNSEAVAMTGTFSSKGKQIKGWGNAYSVDGTTSQAGNCRISTVSFTVASASGDILSNVIPSNIANGRTGAFLNINDYTAVKPCVAQTVTLPAGEYTLKFDVLKANYGDAAGSTITSYFGWVPNSGTPVYLPDFAIAALNTWETKSVTFTLDAMTTGKIQLGFSKKVWLAIDNVKLLYTGDATSAVAPLKTELTALKDSVNRPASYNLTAVNTLLTTVATTENALQLISDLSAAIATLKQVIAQNVDTSLASLTVDGTAISGFAPKTLSYSYLVAGGAGIPVVAATTASTYASANVVQATAAPGDAKITVTAGNGAKQVYAVRFGLPMALPVSGSYYHIKSFDTDSTYIGGSGTSNDAVKHEIADTNSDDYRLFLLTGDNTNGFTFKQVVSGLYVTHNNSYTGSYAAATGTNRQLFNFDNQVNPDYLVIKKKQDNGTFANGIGFNSGISGSTLYFDKGTGAGNKWVFEKVTVTVLIKTALESAITTANDLLTNTVEGTAVGQYPSKASLQAAVGIAQNVLNSATTQIQIDDAVTALNAAIVAYQGTKVFVISSGNVYRIKNYATGNTYMGGNGTGNDAVKHEDASTNPDYQLFLIEGDNTTGWTFLQVASGLYVTHNNSWTGSYAAATGTNTQLFKIDDTQSISYLVIQKKGTSGSFSNGIGWDSGNPVLYFDKGPDKGNRWVFEKVEGAPLVIAPLANLITSAKALHDSAVEGAEPGQYTGSKAALQTAITAAQTVLNAATAVPPTTTQAEINAAKTALQTAVQTFESTIIVVTFAPDATAYYRIYTADQARWANQYLYSSGTAAESNQKHGLLTNDTDSTFLYQFVKENGNWMIRPAAEANKESADQLYIYERGSGGSGMVARTKTAHDKRSRFIVSWVKREAGVDYFSFKSEEGYWLLFGANSNDLKSNGTYGTDPGESSIDATASFQFAIIKADPRTALGQLIGQANAALSSAVVGTEMTQYPQTAVDALTAAVATATSVYNNLDASNDEIKDAVSALKTTYNWFISQQISFSSVYVGKPLWVAHSSGNLLSKVEYNTNAVINVLNTPDALQTFVFEAVPGMVDVVALKSSDEKYLSYNSWNTPWIDSINTNVYMKISATADGYLHLKMVGNNLLGTDADTDSTGVWANKSGDNIRNKWMVQTPGSTITIKLRAAVVKSDTLLNHISVGNATFQFPTADHNAFVSVLNASKAVLAKANATQAEIDAQVIVLSDALTDFYRKQILPVFTPEASDRYLVTNKSYSGYLTDDGIRAVVGTNVPLIGWEIQKLTDSTYVFKNGSLAMAQSLNMATYSSTAADQIWKLHYDGAKAYEVYTPNTDSQFAFIGGTNAMQFTSGGQVQLVAEHSHSAQAQWFVITKVGAPITTALELVIANAQSALSSATVGTAYGQYPQTAKESLTTAIASAQSTLEASEQMTQEQINTAATGLQNSLTWFKNQKIVWKPVPGMAYFIGNRDNANYLSVDTLTAGVAKGYKLDSIPFVNQLWFFEPVENKAGFYYIVNDKKSVGYSGGTSIFVEEYDAATAKGIEVQFKETASGTDYFILVTTNTYPNIHIDANGNIGSDRFTYNNYQMKLVAAGELRTEVFYAVQLRDSARVGNGIGQYPQASYNTFVGVINASIENAMDGNNENDAAQLVLLKAAINTFRTSQNGYGLNLNALLAAVEIATDLVESTTVIGPNPGQCPQATVDALSTAITQSQDATGGITQAIVDQKVTALNQAIATFKSALKASTGLTSLLETCLTQHNEAVEGTDSGQYAVGSKAIFKAAIDLAQVAFDKEPVVQSALIAAYNQLSSAYDTFNAGRIADLYVDDLLDMIAESEEFLAGKPAGEFPGFRAKVDEAKALIANPVKTQEQVDAITEVLYKYLENGGTGIDQLIATGVKVFAGNGALHVSGLTVPAQMVIFNTLGQQILGTKIVDADFVQPLKKGLYIVTLNSIKFKILVR